MTHRRYTSEEIMAETLEQMRARNHRNPVLPVRLPDRAIYEAVVTAASTAGITKSEFVREAISEKLEKERTGK